jgi:hypothetical protein
MIKGVQSSSVDSLTVWRNDGLSDCGSGNSLIILVKATIARSVRSTFVTTTYGRWVRIETAESPTAPTYAKVGMVPLKHLTQALVVRMKPLPILPPIASHEQDMLRVGQPHALQRLVSTVGRSGPKRSVVKVVITDLAPEP